MAIASKNGPRCPENPTDHGPLVPVPNHPYFGWYCPHRSHDGYPVTSPLGPSDPTRAYFTTAEVDAAQSRLAVAG